MPGDGELAVLISLVTELAAGETTTTRRGEHAVYHWSPRRQGGALPWHGHFEDRIEESPGLAMRLN